MIRSLIEGYRKVVDWTIRHYRRPGAGPRRMYDAVNVLAIPTTAKAAAGYVGGKWPTYANGSLRAHCPKAVLLSIAVAAEEDAHCLDVERFDATIPEAAGWYRTHAPRYPVFYTSISQAQKLVDALSAQGIPRSSYRLWTAHYTFRPHRCTSRCGFPLSGKADATQWTDRSLGRSLDESLLSPHFFHRR